MTNSSEELSSRIVFAKHDQPVTTSKIIADYFGRRNNQVMQIVRAQSDKNLSLQKHWCYGHYQTKQNHPMRMMYMDRDCFMMTVMSFNTAKADRIKWRFIKAFDAQEKEIQRLKQSQSSSLANLFNSPRGLKTLGEKLIQLSVDAPKAKLFDIRLICQLMAEHSYEPQYRNETDTPAISGIWHPRLI